MRLLGIDYGEKRIGLALSDQEQNMAFPYGVISNNHNIFTELKSLCKKEKVEKIILGYPLDYKNQPTTATPMVLEFKTKLEQKLGLSVELEKEVLTTKEAAQIQGYHKKIDASAAALILNSYLMRKNMIK
ncbi:MAG: Holliday junction resolvase RuvX [Candidatus Nealsonbacteria bacterium]|nr:MAG: Holliday junction resolvase RuvX [Candidatus Nealsonbacteria bacterium]